MNLIVFLANKLAIISLLDLWRTECLYRNIYVDSDIFEIFKYNWINSYVCMEPAGLNLHTDAGTFDLRIRLDQGKMGFDPSLGFYTAFNWILQRIFALHKDTGGEGVAALYRSVRNKRWRGERMRCHHPRIFLNCPPKFEKKGGKRGGIEGKVPNWT